MRNEEQVWRVRVRGQPVEVEFDARPGETLLQASLRAAQPLRSACRNGTCRSCLCRLEHGQVVHTIEWPGLSAEEKRDGFILPCVAQARGDVVLRPAGT